MTYHYARPFHVEGLEDEQFEDDPFYWPGGSPEEVRMWEKEAGDRLAYAEALYFWEEEGGLYPPYDAGVDEDDEEWIWSANQEVSRVYGLLGEDKANKAYESFRERFDRGHTKSLSVKHLFTKDRDRKRKRKEERSEPYYVGSEKRNKQWYDEEYSRREREVEENWNELYRGIN